MPSVTAGAVGAHFQRNHRAPSERLNVGLELTRMSRDLRAQGIRARHPEYSDDEVKWAVMRVWIGRDLFLRAYPHCRQLDP